jgi:APA family basic amino acid/polyamine antiporter
MNATEPTGQSPETGHGKLGVWDTVCIIVGIVIGTTIFEMPWLIFANTSNPWMGLAVWFFGGFLALVGGLCYAELGATYPRAGGDYYYLTRAFGRCVGFLFGWAQLSVILPASIGVMAFVFATQATEVRSFPDYLNLGLNSEFYYASLAVLVITFLNLFGATLGKVAQNILTLAKMVGLLAILVCGFLIMKPSATNWSLPLDAKDWGWGSLAVILVLYAYGGWNDAAFVAAEVREPGRNIPRALLFGIGIITIVYVLINFAFILGLGFDQVRDFDQVRQRGSLPAQLLNEAMGPNGAMAMRLIIMVSALGAVNGLIFTGSRVYATLGADHRLFGFVGHWAPGKGAPMLALLLQALITLLFVLLFGTEKGHAAINQFLGGLNSMLTSIAQVFHEDYVVKIEYSETWQPRDAFGQLVSHSAPAFWLFFLLTGFSLFVLRDKNPGVARPFSVPCYPLVPFIFCNMCIYMLYQATIYIEWRALFVVVLLLLGLPLYWLSQAPGQPRSQTSAGGES